MKTRCYNHLHQAHKYYVAKNITICDSWLYNFMNFYNWAIQNGYENGLSIERINNDGNYCPENCKWIHKNLQAKNRSSNHYITAWGETKILQDWTKDARCKVPRKTFSNRIKKGIHPEIAMTQKHIS
jgi:hypothetical protein